jgi:hypothetical protein
MWLVLQSEALMKSDERGHGEPRWEVAFSKDSEWSRAQIRNADGVTPDDEDVRFLARLRICYVNLPITHPPVVADDDEDRDIAARNLLRRCRAASAVFSRSHLKQLGFNQCRARGCCGSSTEAP